MVGHPNAFIWGKTKYGFLLFAQVSYLPPPPPSGLLLSAENEQKMKMKSIQKKEGFQKVFGVDFLFH